MRSFCCSTACSSGCPGLQRRGQLAERVPQPAAGKLLAQRGQPGPQRQPGLRQAGDLLAEPGGLLGREGSLRLDMTRRIGHHLALGHT